MASRSKEDKLEPRGFSPARLVLWKSFADQDDDKNNFSIITNEIPGDSKGSKARRKRLQQVLTYMGQQAYRRFQVVVYGLNFERVLHQSLLTEIPKLFPDASTSAVMDLLNGLIASPDSTDHSTDIYNRVTDENPMMIRLEITDFFRSSLGRLKLFSGTLYCKVVEVGLESGEQGVAPTKPGNNGRFAMITSLLSKNYSEMKSKTRAFFSKSKKSLPEEFRENLIFFVCNITKGSLMEISRWRESRSIDRQHGSGLPSRKQCVVRPPGLSVHSWIAKYNSNDFGRFAVQLSDRILEADVKRMASYTAKSGMSVFGDLILTADEAESFRNGSQDCMDFLGILLDRGIITKREDGCYLYGYLAYILQMVGLEELRNEYLQRGSGDRNGGGKGSESGSENGSGGANGSGGRGVDEQEQVKGGGLRLWN